MVEAPRSPHKAPQPPPHARRAVIAVVVVVALLLLWPWLSMFSAAGYSYLWWVWTPEVHWTAAPAPAGNNSSAVVPKLLHQTWQTREVPAKWAAARQSCIDLHPDYEHRLWTDDDGLKFIEVRRRRWRAWRMDGAQQGLAGGCGVQPTATARRPYVAVGRRR